MAAALMLAFVIWLGAVDLVGGYNQMDPKDVKLVDVDKAKSIKDLLEQVDAGDKNRKNKIIAVLERDEANY